MLNTSEHQEDGVDQLVHRQRVGVGWETNGDEANDHPGILPLANNGPIQSFAVGYVGFCECHPQSKIHDLVAWAKAVAS